MKKTIIIIFLLSLFFFPALFSSRSDSATTDEGIHIASGYTYLKKWDFRFDPEHPPFLKELSALPVLFLKPKVSFDQDEWKNAADFRSDTWQKARSFGYKFLYQNETDKILFLGRLPFILLGLLLGFFIFKWAKELYGFWPGILALFFFTLDPNILAHSRLINTDLGLVLFFFLSVYFWGRYLKKPTNLNLILTGISFGLALASKYTALILILVLPVLLLIKYYLDKKGGLKPALSKYLFSLLFIFIFGFLMVFAFYGFSAHQLAYYFKGIKMFLSHSLSGHGTFLLGKYSIIGFWYYFPLAFLIKTPITTLIFLIFSIIFFKKLTCPPKSQHELRPEADKLEKANAKIGRGSKDIFNEYLLIVPVVIFFGLAMLSKANLGLRHILVIYPFLFVFISRLANFKFSAFSKTIFFLLLLFYLISSLRIYPCYLAYFNEAIGGPKNGYKYLLNSNLDWGQDVKRLKKYLDKNQIKEIYLDYFYDKESLDYYKINYKPLSPKDKDKKGYLVLNAMQLQTSRDENGNTYEWLRKEKPIEKIGYSIFVYKRE